MTLGFLPDVDVALLLPPDLLFLRLDGGMEDEMSCARSLVSNLNNGFRWWSGDMSSLLGCQALTETIDALFIAIYTFPTNMPRTNAPTFQSRGTG